MKPVDDEVRNAPGQPDATPERSLAEMARELVGGTISRRQVLRWIGGTLAGAVLARFPGSPSAATTPGETNVDVPTQHGGLPRGLLLPAKNRSLEGRFGLMFKKLPAFEPPDDFLIELAKTMTEVTEEPSDLDNPKIPSGFVFLGQFIDHDLTFDRTPLDLQRQDPDAVTNYRAATFNLDSVYGKGPPGSPELYDPVDPAKLRLSSDRPYDLPRWDDETAIIGDNRDDENLVTSQLHLAFRKFHNALVDHVRRQGLRTIDEIFPEAQRLCRWHYQWMVVHDFLARIVGEGVIKDILQERANAPAQVKLTFYKPKNPNKPMMPVEFAVAAYRFGHSMLRPGYVLNEQGERAILFGKVPEGFVGNLNGKRRIPPNLVISWRHFFEIPRDVDGSPPANSARRIDTRLAAPLFTLPEKIVPPPPSRNSLAERNLLRGKMLGLPSGQEVARQMGVEALSNQELGDGSSWNGQTPLWFYILKEAENKPNNGERLGAVGGTIVAEVFLGLLRLDKDSYLRQDPSWRPQPPIATEAGKFGMGDLLRFARVA